MTYPVHFTQCFDLIYKALPDALKSPEQANLKAVATLLPPFTHLGGLEIRLAPDDPQIDIGIDYRVEDAPILSAHLAQNIESNPHFKHPGWRHLHAFAQDWASSEMGTLIPHVTLEIDIPTDQHQNPIPMVFFFSDAPYPFEGDLPAATAKALHYMVSADEARKLSGYLERCFAALQAGDTWRGIGLMVGRDLGGVRILLKLNRQRVIPYLQAIGWQGNPQALAPVFDLFEPVKGDMLVYIDVGDKIGARIGFAKMMMPDFKTALYAPNIKVMLEQLLKRGLCQKPKADAFKNLNRFPIFPINSSLPWMDGLMIEALHRPPTDFSQMRHVVLSFKVNYMPNTPLEVKAYSAFFHHWSQYS